MKTKPFNLEEYKAGAQVITRSGLSARLASDKMADSRYPLLWIVTSHKGDGTITTTKDGYEYEEDDDRDRERGDYDMFIVDDNSFTMPDALTQVAEFHKSFGAPVAKKPVIIDAARASLRIALIAEEFSELREAIAGNDLVEIADALCDLQYVIAGTILEYGLGSQFEKLFNRVHESNMSKGFRDETTARNYARKITNQHPTTVDDYLTKTYDNGETWVVERTDGKIMKSPTYIPAELGNILEI